TPACVPVLDVGSSRREWDGLSSAAGWASRSMLSSVRSSRASTRGRRKRNRDVLAGPRNRVIRGLLVLMVQSSSMGLRLAGGRAGRLRGRRGNVLPRALRSSSGADASARHRIGPNVCVGISEQRVELSNSGRGRQLGRVVQGAVLQVTLVATPR